MRGKKDNAGGPKHVVQTRKACNIVSANLALQNDGKNIPSISEAFQLLIHKKKGKRNLHCNIS